jgi:hypothetical protein
VINLKEYSSTFNIWLLSMSGLGGWIDGNTLSRCGLPNQGTEFRKESELKTSWANKILYFSVNLNQGK